MNQTQDFAAIRKHYQAAISDPQALLGRIDERLAQLDGPLTSDRLATFDQFHVGGLAATAELARRLAPKPGMRVLDAGSGLGGPARYLAETHGVEVVGVDLAPIYVDVATALAMKAGLNDQVRFIAGSITSLPFEDEHFSAVWTQHVVMNIADRDGLYRELRRVLKPGGRFAFFDPYLPDAGEPPVYPTPWAETPEHSTLLTRAQTVAALEKAGLEVIAWDDVTELGSQWVAA